MHSSNERNGCLMLIIDSLGPFGALARLLTLVLFRSVAIREIFRFRGSLKAFDGLPIGTVVEHETVSGDVTKELNNGDSCAYPCYLRSWHDEDGRWQRKDGGRTGDGSTCSPAPPQSQRHSMHV
jgi:hypothetical protein